MGWRGGSWVALVVMSACACADITDASSAPSLAETIDDDAGAPAPSADASPPGSDGDVVPQPPARFPAPPASAENPTTSAGFTLGRRLFYDPRLSSNGRVSCATCHDPAIAFTIPSALPTAGVSGKALVRHPPSLVNLAWATSGLFWDGGSKNLESLALAPLTHPDEMGREGKLDAMMDVVVADATYRVLFAAAFAEEEPRIGRLLQALAQFQRSIYSGRARWDDVGAGVTSFDEAEARGARIFERSCARCHTPGLFTDAGYHNNGLDASFGDDLEGPTRGRGRITFSSDDAGKYRTPTLRNVTSTAPYMHDGRFASLDAVVEHYRRGMIDSPTLDPGFRRSGEGPGVTMSDGDASDLEAFLRTLDDPRLATDPAYANPFLSQDAP